MSINKLAEAINYLRYQGHISFDFEALEKEIVKDTKEHLLEDNSELINNV